MNVLLVEPSYKNKYPPIGLMKISTYHKNRGDNVWFYKGKMPCDTFIACEFERVYITSLFTFYYNTTIETVEYYERLIDQQRIFVGGIMASLLTQKLRDDTNIIHILTGLLSDSAVLGLNDQINIDSLPLDFSILDEIEYEYPAGDHYISYTTRGCPNNCPFCAVPLLEPHYENTNNIYDQITRVNALHGEKRNLLLLDNNIFNLSVSELEELVSDLHKLGFTKRPTFYRTNPYEQFVIKHENPKLSKRVLDNAIMYLNSLKDKFKDEAEKQQYLAFLSNLDKLANKSSYLIQYKEYLLKAIRKNTVKLKVQRYVDFNQGLEAARISPEKMQVLSQLPLKPVRIAFDHYTPKAVDTYKSAIEIAHKNGINDFSNYMLYNYDDYPEDLWYRLEINIKLAKYHNISIFSFPMKYMPISHTNRKYISPNWNKKYLQAITAILLVTKGIVASGEKFFYRAFGATPEEYLQILSMPRDFIIYRKYYEDIGLTETWKALYNDLNSLERKELIRALNSPAYETESPVINRILRFYTKEYDYTNLKRAE